MKTQREALKLAKATAKILNWKPLVSRGWKPIVWENLGWHAKAVSACGRWKIHPHIHNGKIGYTAFLGNHDTGGKWAESGSTCRAAINAVRARARADLREIEKLLEARP